MLFIFIPLVVVIIDQLSKIYIKNNFYLYQSFDVIEPYLKFTYIENRGIAFGIDTSSYHLFITILTIVVILFFIYYFVLQIINDSIEKIPLGLILGGAIGNAIDRILVLFPKSGYVGVIDFIDIGYNGFRWYVFNVADLSISCGAILYALILFKSQNNERNSKYRIKP